MISLTIMLVFVAVLTFLLGSFIELRKRLSYRGSIESRLHAGKAKRITNKDELIRIRSERSLTPEGNYFLTLFSINELLLQSGTDLGIRGAIALPIGTGLSVYLSARLGGLPIEFAIPAGVVAGLIIPVMILRTLRDRRRDKFERQLPDAIDVLVRGLRAGHSLPTAIISVGRHMPDPIGAEFALTGAEVTYGLDLETAMVNLSTRVGQADLSLMVLAVSI